MHSCWISYAKLLCLFAAMSCTLLALASPTLGALMNPAGALLLRQTADGPQFPDEPKSCPICARDYWNVNSCCQAAPVLANFTNVIFNPGAFVDVIMCACGDTFQSAYPQCVDCLQRTGQEAFLYATSDELPGIITGIRNVCAISSALLGNVSESNGDVTPSPPPPPPIPTASGAQQLRGGVDQSLPPTLAIVTVFLVSVL